ncbi:MAG: hypothetical protein ACO1NW_09130 [Chitinophagaceae bacterium]
MKRIEREPTLEFTIEVNGNMVNVKAKPYMANDKRRFRVSYNGSPVHIFGWDSSTNTLKAIESAAADNMPTSIEYAIGAELNHRLAA